MNIRCRNLDKGQSLVEFILMVPLFFIVLSGVNLYLNQEIKSLTEDSAYDSLLISDSHFDSEERKMANWNGAGLDTSKYNAGILDNAFNSSKYHPSVNMEDGVFRDKKNIKNDSNDYTKNPFYKLNSSQSGEFKFSSCADANGFEKAKFFSYQDIFEDFKITNKKQTGKSIFYPVNEDFAWKNRHLMASNAIKYFAFTPEGISFKSLYASLSLPKDKAQFNSECLMNPKTTSCSIPPLNDLWNKVALFSGAMQIGLCDIEMITKCGGPEDLPCMLLVAEQTTAAFLGNKASLCSILNNATQGIYEEVLLSVNIHSIATLTSESAQRVMAPF